MTSANPADRYTDDERSLLDEMIQQLRAGSPESPGPNQADATKMASEMLDGAIREAKEAGTYELPPTLGDILLGRKRNDVPAIERWIEDTKKKLPERRVDGVRNEDILWWWNLPDVARRVFTSQDELTLLVVHLSIKERSSHLSEDEIGEHVRMEVRKRFPVYGPLKDESGRFGEEDRPLPPELRNRILEYHKERFSADRATMENEVRRASSFNAWVREKIHSGEL